MQAAGAHANVRIEAVRSGADLDAIRELFCEYVTGLGIDLTFQGVEAEFAQLPGKYAPPGGELFLAKRSGGYPVGCAGVAPLDELGVCLMKRLYVRPAGRGTGTGRALAEATIAFAQSCGYREMLLDTLPFMGAAISMYRALGFEAIPAFYENPVPGALFFKKDLRDANVSAVAD